MKVIVKIVLAGIAASSALSPTVGWAKARAKKAPSPTPSTSTRALSDPQRLEELEQKQKVLERNLELKEEKLAEQEKSKIIAGAGSDGFSLKSADGAYVIKFRGYIQADTRFFFDDNEKRPNNTFELRRVRPILEGSLTKYLDFKFMPDFGEGKVVIQDAYFDTKIKPQFKIRVGKFKPPVGLERLASGTNLTFVERGLPTSLVPNRDVGLEIFGDFWDGVLGYELGVFNGVADGASGDLDFDGGKEFAGRVFAHPFKKSSVKPLQGLGLGVSGSIGSQTGSEATPNLPSYKTPGQQTFFSYRSDGTAENTTVADGTHFRISPQGYFYYGPFGLLGEYVISSQQVRRQAESAEILNQSWQVLASYVIYGGEASYKGVNPKKPLGWKSKGPGAFEIAARYGETKIDAAAFPFFADPDKAARKAQAWGVGFNWYANKNAKVTLSYDQTHFDGGAKGGGDRVTEKALFTRYQLAF